MMMVQVPSLLGFYFLLLLVCDGLLDIYVCISSCYVILFCCCYC